MMISKATKEHIDTIFNIYQECRIHMDSQGIHQWTESYPHKQLIVDNINKGEIYILCENENIIGVISLEANQPGSYNTIDWNFDSTKICIIKRLAIAPSAQGKGYAKELMLFAEKETKSSGYEVIRLDSNSTNLRNKHFYENAGYRLCKKQIAKEHKDSKNYCFEKKI